MARPTRFTLGLLCATLMGIALYAPAPRAVATPTTVPANSQRPGDDSYDWAQWRQFWSFKPITKPAPPAVKDAGWVRNPIDAFVLAKLEAAGLRPAPEADRVTLIRRATFDLTGIPPTPQEIRAFLADKSPDAFERVIDRLLASPHYGERWGRHWLDVARYVPGRINFPGIKQTAGDQAYRDYVVRALNKDKPYDGFVTEQLAGDLLPPSPDREQEFDQITAPAFLSIGAWFDMCTDPNRLKLEMVDEMVNTTSKAFLGLSVACARCHDHKFDPIPTQDYYALGGIFRSTRLVGDFSEFWRDGRVRQLRPLAMPDEVAANDAIRAKIAAKKTAQWQYLTEHYDERMKSWSADEPRYRAAAAKFSPKKTLVRLFEAENFDGVSNLRIAQLQKDGKGIDLIESLNPTSQWVKYKIDVPDAGEYRLDALYCTDDRVPVQVTVNGPVQVPAALAEPTGGWDLKYLRWGNVGTIKLRDGLNFVRLNATNGDFPRIDRFRLYKVDDGFDDEVNRLAAEDHLDPLVLRGVVIDPEHPWPTHAGIAPYLPPDQQQAIAGVTTEMDALEKTIKPYPLVVAVTDQPKCEDLPVHIKGDTYRTAKYVPQRGVPRVLDGLLPPPQISPGHSGRLELARWLTDPRNPLPARVMANRIWQGHFGRGIVATPSDFGSRGVAPTHPQLLDWLASSFVENGWSMKRLHREILLSSTYRMSGSPDPESGDRVAQSDPENKLLSHFTRRRLEAEELYDSMLGCINTLVRQDPGKPLDVDKSKNKALYVLTSGRAPKGLGPEVRKMLTLFDVDFTGVPIDTRPQSNTPAQSLFWLNSPLPQYFAGRFAERLLKMDQLNDTKRVEMAYLISVGHSPDRQASDEALAFLGQCEQDGMTKQDAWTQFGLALFASTEFHYVD
jgi:hypothetical protein